MSLVGVVLIVLVLLCLISLFVVAIRSGRWSLLCFGLLIVAGIVYLGWTAGFRSRDWVAGLIYAEGANTILVIDGCEVVLEEVPWPAGEMEFTMQVSGWTRSAFVGPGTTYIRYAGGGENEITVDRVKLKLRASGREILIGDTFTRLEPDRRVRVPADPAPPPSAPVERPMAVR